MFGGGVLAIALPGGVPFCTTTVLLDQELDLSQSI